MEQQELNPDSAPTQRQLCQPRVWPTYSHPLHVSTHRGVEEAPQTLSKYH
jgi:hypothetical protein